MSYDTTVRGWTAAAPIFGVAPYYAQKVYLTSSVSALFVRESKPKMSYTNTFLFATVCLLVFLPTASAFGAGEIPDFAYLNGICSVRGLDSPLTAVADRAFRHGDIENILENIVRWKGSSTAAGGILGAAIGILSAGGIGEKKFTKADVQRVYFVSETCPTRSPVTELVAQGNWLRDYCKPRPLVFGSRGG